MNLFHVSKNPNIKTLVPKVPNNWLTQNGLEEARTPRISFATSVDRCLRGVYATPKTTYYVYVPVSIDKNYLRRPSVKDVPDRRLTNEYWYLKPVNVRLYGIVKSGKFISKDIYRVALNRLKTLKSKSPEEYEYYKENGFANFGLDFKYLKKFNKKGREIKAKDSMWIDELVDLGDN